jgi:hypothetical protein
VQTDAVHRHVGAAARSHSIRTSSLITGTGSSLPGTTIRSGYGNDSGLSVGITVRPRSQRTGSSDRETKWTFASGQRLMTA